MKKLLILISILFLSTMYSGCQKEIKENEKSIDIQTTKNDNNQTKEKEQEEKETNNKNSLEGVWINENYNGEGRSGKVVYEVISENLLNYTAYDSSDGSGNVYKGTSKINSIWEEDGMSYGKSIVTLEGGMSWDTLFRISNNNTLEVQSGVEEIDPDGPRYSIYYRK